VALADIITKIEADAEVEAASIVEAAEQRATAIRAEAADRAMHARVSLLAEAEAEAERDASRIVASARLAARDEGLMQRRALVTETLAGVVDALASLRDTEYASFLASRVVAVARGGETLRFGRADSPLAGPVAEALRVAAPELSLDLSPEVAPFERGALVEGPRVRADLSLGAIVEERRDELELLVAQALFGEGV
jgi:vacuolar-type H+-ATPase subunit E/Vma4